MLNLSNKRVTYTIDYEIEDMKVIGECELKDGHIESLTGQIHFLGKDTFLIGSFSYNEQAGMINKVISDASIEKLVEIESIINLVILNVRAIED